MKYFFLFFLLFSTVFYCQPGRLKKGENLQRITELKPTIQTLPDQDSGILLSYMYRIPHNRLIFEREENAFNSSVRIQVEVYSDDELITREFVDRKVSVEDFNLVKSRSASIQGTINFSLSDKIYTIKGVATDLNLQKDISFQPVEINLNESIEAGIYKPIIIKSDEINCDGYNLPICVNRGGAIPFSPNRYDLIIPVSDTSISSIKVEIKNDSQDPFITDVSDNFTGKINILECNGQVFIGSENSAIQTKNFILRDINKALEEGRILASIKISKEKFLELPIEVEWINKPFSLKNPEFAIEMLKYIDDEAHITKLLAADEKEYHDILIKYWKDYDPTPETEFNELMEEFYSRIDYAAMEFRGINTRDGLSTDRGRIYIKNGKPDNIERFSNDDGYIVEIWIYKGTKKIFQFVDKQGTGNFILIES